MEFCVDEGLNKSDILGFVEFHQELFPLIQRMHPTWDINETRRRYRIDKISSLYNNKLSGVSNIKLGENIKRDFEAPFEIGQFKNQPWWIRSTIEDISGGQVEDKLRMFEDVNTGQHEIRAVIT